MEPLVNIPPIYRLWSLPFDDGIFHCENSLAIASESVDANTEFEVISNVHGMEVSEVLGKHIGIGKISGRICYKSGRPVKVGRIWLEWLGNVDVDSVEDKIPEHRISVLTFSVNKQLDSGSPRGVKGEGKCCEICLQDIFPRKDVGVLIECKKIFCINERACHIYHLSCLLQLILLCEAVDVELANRWHPPPPGKYYIPGTESEQGCWYEIPEEEEEKVVRTDCMMRTLFCPLCDQTRPYAFASMAECRERLTRAREEWLNTPESLENCVSLLKMLKHIRKKSHQSICCTSIVLNTEQISAVASKMPRF